MPAPSQPPTIEQVCEKALRLPCSPSLLPRLAEALQSDESSALEIERLISLDSSLAAATLRLANSAAFGRGGIETLEGAIFRLGAKEIFRLAALVLVNRWELGTKPGANREPGDFSRHALCTAIAAEVLAERTGRVEGQAAYTAGLVIDLGKLALVHCGSDFYPSVQAACTERKIAWEQAETAVFGFNHADVSVRLLKAWKFPERFVSAAKFMLRPTEAPQDILPMLSHLHAGKYLATSFGPGVPEEGFLSTLHGNFLQEWGFTAEMLEQAMPIVLERASARLGEKLTQGIVSI
ncbi:MAG TPA: HDOD domain-containing protein [Candidatus Didemnitutus sp.]|nr:HDOD domain-containing protein [Candidatus Didemnitutus sp.]